MHICTVIISCIHHTFSICIAHGCSILFPHLYGILVISSIETCRTSKKRLPLLIYVLLFFATGYGISTTTTTSAPADDSVKVMWIVGGFFAGLAIIVIVAIALSCLKMKRCSWKPQPKPIVHEESLEGLVGKSVIAVERSVSCEQTRAPLPLGFQSRTATSPI